MTPLPGHVVVCLHSGKSAIGSLIRWQTRSCYSHASLILPIGWHVEAREFKGVVAHDKFTAPATEAVDAFAIPLSCDQLSQLFDFVSRELGAPYDYAMVWHFVTRGGPIRSSEKRWFCSEFVYAALRAAGVELLRATEPWEVSPGLLARAPQLKLLPIAYRELLQDQGSPGPGIP